MNEVSIVNNTRIPFVIGDINICRNYSMTTIQNDYLAEIGKNIIIVDNTENIYETQDDVVFVKVIAHKPFYVNNNYIGEKIIAVEKILK